MRRNSFVVRAIWAACLLIAGANHARILLQQGLGYDYGGAGWASAAYWSGLTLIDPLVAALLFVRPRLGIVSTIVLIGTNVVHNLAVTADRAPQGEFLHWVGSNPYVLCQIAFLAFVAATARTAWRGVDVTLSAERSG